MANAVTTRPDLILLSIGGKDFLNSQTVPEPEQRVRYLIDARESHQETLARSSAELPSADVLVNPVHDDLTCDSNEYHLLSVSLWNQMLHDLVWAQGNRFSVLEVYPESAHQDLNGTTCTGEQDLICPATACVDSFCDGVHPNRRGCRS